MSDYEYNDDKPEALLTGYATVRGAELKSIFRLLKQQGDVGVSAFERRFALPNADSGTLQTDHVTECLKFLQAIDMVEISAQDIASPMNQGLYPHLDSFEARVLHHVRQQEGEQYHLSYIFDVAVKTDRRRLTEEVLLEEVRGDDSRSFGLNWNEEKLRMWANLVDQLGGISYMSRRARDRDDNEILLSPNRRLLADLLAWHQTNAENGDRFARALECIDEEFVPVFSERASTPKVAAGVADVLNGMEADGVLEMNAMSDTEDVIEVPRSSQSGSRNIVTYELAEIPTRPSYSYPLARDEREVVA